MLNLMRLLLQGAGALAIAFAFLYPWLGYGRFHVYLPHFVFTQEANNNIVSIQGTWNFPDTGNPYQATSLECKKQIGVCLEASAIISENLLLPVEVKERKILSWNNERVIVQGETSFCRRSTYEIGLQSQIVSGVSRWLPDADPTICSGLIDKSDRRFQMIDGWKVSHEWRRNPPK